MQRNLIETLTGAFILVVALFVTIFFINKTEKIGIMNNQYPLIAKFENIDGVEQGSPVKIGGVNVGVVLSKELDLKTYFAVLHFSIDKNIKLPIDSTAKISSEGLLGGKFLSITPGGDENMLESNGEIKYTQSSVNLETLIGKMIFSKDKPESEK